MQEAKEVLRCLKRMDIQPQKEIVRDFLLKIRGAGLRQDRPDGGQCLPDPRDGPEDRPPFNRIRQHGFQFRQIDLPQEVAYALRLFLRPGDDDRHAAGLCGQAEVRVVQVVARVPADPLLLLQGAEEDRDAASVVVLAPVAMLEGQRESRDLVRRVLSEDGEIPRGRVMTYGGLAASLGVPGGARAVGNAMAGNPFPLVIPCHRVVRSDGSLGGFGGGLSMKRALLAMEGVRFDPKGRVFSEYIL